MAKQNRRINLAKREANELRQQLEDHKIVHRCELDNSAIRERAANSQRDRAEAQLAEIERRLRRICEHFYALPAKTVNLPDSPGVAWALLKHMDPRLLSQDLGSDKGRTPYERIFRLVMWMEKDAVHLQRYIHMRMENPGQALRAGYAISETTLAMLRAAQLPDMADAIAREMSANIYNALKHKP